MEHDLRIHRRDPLRLLFHLFLRIILSRNDQGRQFYMTVFRCPADKSFHSLQIPAQLPVICFREPFQINVHRINIRKEFFQHENLCRAVCDKYILHSPLPDQLCRIPDKFISDKRFIVGVCHSDIFPSVSILTAAAVCRQLCQFLRRDFPVCRPDSIRHGDLVVLTERTGQIAPEASHRQDQASGEKLFQRLLLYGIQRQRRDLPIIITNNLSLLIPSRSAPSPLSFRQPAVMGTDRADRCTSVFSQKCLTTSKRSRRISSASSGIPAFLLAISICSSTVSTPSRFGSRSPLLRPRLTTTP